MEAVWRASCLLGALALHLLESPASVVCEQLEPARPAGRRVLQVPGSNWFGSGLNNLNAPGGFTPTPSRTSAPTGTPAGGGPDPTGGAPPNGAANSPAAGGSAGAIGQGSACPDQSAVLGQHNQERAGSGAAPLKWSPSLAAKAAAWSAKCTPDPLGGYAHAPGKLTEFGESIAWGEQQGDLCASSVETWLGEKASWSRSSPDNPNAGHWTQMVWQATTEVGCGIAMCRQGTVGPEYFLTCRYSPPGNKGGTAEFAKNLPA